MTDEEHKRILAAGVEFYSGLSDLLRKYELTESHAPSLVLVSMGAVLSGTDMTAQQLVDAGSMLQKYWTLDLTSDLPLNVRFEDPNPSTEGN